MDFISLFIKSTVRDAFTISYLDHRVEKICRIEFYDVTKFWRAEILAPMENVLRVTCTYIHSHRNPWGTADIVIPEISRSALHKKFNLVAYPVHEIRYTPQVSMERRMLRRRNMSIVIFFPRYKSSIAISKTRNGLQSGP